MKKFFAAILVLLIPAGAHAQGLVELWNRNSAGTTHVWAPSTNTPFLSYQGLGLNDNPSGTVDYAGAGMFLIGAHGSGGLGGYGTTFAQYLAAPGSGVPEFQLVPSGITTTFRTQSAGAGTLVPVGDTLENVPPDAPFATLELVAWDNSSGLYSTWSLASVAWSFGQIAAGKSGAFTVASIGGNENPPPTFLIPSFNIWVIPEPSTVALVLLGAAASLTLRRRK
jgi:hypothetical protein